MDKITVEVIEAIDLMPMDISGTSDPFCTIFLTNCEEHHKTKTIKKTLFPQWNEVFTFNNVKSNDPTAQLIVSCYDWDRFRTQDFILSNNFMGQVFIPLPKLAPNVTHDEWYDLAPRKGKGEKVKGKIHLKLLLSSQEAANILQRNRSRLSSAFNLDSPLRRRFADVASPDVMKKLTFEQAQRQEVLFELLETERQYVGDLTIIVEVFMKPLKNILTKQEIASLFANIETIYALHKELLDDLEDNQEDPQNTIGNIAPTIAKYVDKFKFYAVYCSNQPTTSSKIKAYKEKSNAFFIFLEECLANPDCRRLDFSSFLIKPLQRLCKYPLLLRELLKSTSAEHAEYSQLNEVFKQVNEVVNSVNERTRQVERLQQLIDLNETFEDLKEKTSKDFELVIQSRFFKRSVEAKLLSKKSIQRDDVELHLFNDIMIMTKVNKKGGAKKQVKKVFLLRDLVINEVEDHPDNVELVDTSGGKIYTIVLPEERNVFIKDLESGVEQYSIKRFLKETRRRTFTSRDLSDNQKLLTIEKQLVTDAESVIVQMQRELEEAKNKNQKLEEELKRYRNDQTISENGTSNVSRTSSIASFSSKDQEFSENNLPQTDDVVTLRRNFEEAQKLLKEAREANNKLKEENNKLNEEVKKLSVGQVSVGEYEKERKKQVELQSEAAALKRENAKLSKESEELRKDVKKVYRHLRKLVKGNGKDEESDPQVNA